MMRNGIIDNKYFNELRQRVENRAWDAVYTGSEKKLQESINLVIAEIKRVRSFLIERGVLIPDSQLLKSDNPEFKKAVGKWKREQEQKAKKKETEKAKLANQPGTQTTLVVV